MTVKRFNLCIPSSLIVRLDAAVKDSRASRSAYIRDAIELKIAFDNMVAEEDSRPDSYFNLLRAAKMRKASYRHLNQYRSKDPFEE